MKMKITECRKCNKEKTLAEFHRNTLSKDGRRAICVKCTSETTALKKKNEDLKNKKSNAMFQMMNKK